MQHVYNVPTNVSESNVPKWPDVKCIDVMNYVLFSQSRDPKEELKIHKSLPSYKLFQDGWIQQILHEVIGDLHLFRCGAIPMRYLTVWWCS